MPNDGKLYDPMGYSIWMLILALACIEVVIFWCCAVVWLTRKKKQRTLASLAPLAPIVPDVPAIQRKYLSLIDEIDIAYQQGNLKSRTVHQRLSILLRFFVQETKGLRAYALTLSDLRKTRYDALVSAIESYYVPEFHLLYSHHFRTNHRP